eukprot:547709_1
MSAEMKEQKSNYNSDNKDNKPDKIIISASSGIRNDYESMGVQNYYIQHGNDYRNPHEIKINYALNKLLFNNDNKWIKQIDFSYILDLCCGSGEMTIYLQNYLQKSKQHKTDNNIKIDAIDPYTDIAYFNRTGIKAYKYNFEDIQNGILWELNSKYYSLIICSYALHLCKLSRLSSVCYCMSMIGKKLLIITPHKRPIIDKKMGWNLLYENVDQKVRIRLYESIYFINQ